MLSAFNSALLYTRVLIINRSYLVFHLNVRDAQSSVDYLLMLEVFAEA